MKSALEADTRGRGKKSHQVAGRLTLDDLHGCHHSTAALEMTQKGRGVGTGVGWGVIMTSM